MHCGEFEERLNDWLDGLRPELDFAASAHARKCAKCGELLAGHEILMSAVQVMPLPEPSPDFARRVVSAALAPKKKSISPWSHAASWAAWGSPLAAAVLVGFVSFVRWLAPVGPGGEAAVAPSGFAPTRVVAQASSRYLALLREKGQQVWPQLDHMRQRGLAVTGITPPAWVGHVTEGLRPLPSSLSAGAMLIAPPLASPMGAALMAMQGSAPGA